MRYNRFYNSGENRNKEITGTRDVYGDYQKV